MKTFLVLCSVSCVLSTAVAQDWAGPFQLSNDTFADINPSACREWVDGTATRLVWQSNRNGGWDIYSRLCYFQNGNGWEAKMPVCTDSGDDITPVITPSFDVMRGWVYWCVWERRESPTTGRIMAASADADDTVWSAPVEIGPCPHTSSDSAWPSMTAIRHDAADTAWVAWTNHDTSSWYVECAYNAGDSWTTPMIAVAQADPIRHARLGRGHHDCYYGCPLLTWETNGDIFYSEYLDGSWQVPQEVAHSAALDRNPDIVSYTYAISLGPWITWESTRDGDTAIYGTAADTFSIGRRWCDAGGAGSNFTPCGTPAVYPMDPPYEPIVAAWVSDRNGNADIYSGLSFNGEDQWVDTSSSADMNPTVTTMGTTENWCVWQSNRTGNWDIWASYIYSTGVAETPSARRRTRNDGPTILSSSSVQSLGSMVIFDAMGRRVLHPTSGVYFMTEDGARSTIHARKVVIQR